MEWSGGDLESYQVSKHLDAVHTYVIDISVNSFLLNLTGIIFAVQFVALLILGAYGDYGKWRPWILISFTAMLYLCQFAISAINKPTQWWGAQVCYVAGIVGMSSA
jgi:MFS-type transporter involved in bile tolerance (Atg22 family)